MSQSQKPQTSVNDCTPISLRNTRVSKFNPRGDRLTMDFPQLTQKPVLPTRQAVHNGKSLTLPPPLEPESRDLRMTLADYFDWQKFQFEERVRSFGSRLGGVA